MSTKIIELEDRIITDGGDVVFKYDFFLNIARSGEVFTNFKALDHPEIKMYNFRKGGNPIEIWNDDGEAPGPDKETFKWIIPDEYAGLDLNTLSTMRLDELDLVTPEYQDRLSYELSEMDKRGMFPFVRCVLYVVDILRKNNIVWGVGRGSSCASLVLFVLGINKVDPVKYDIPVKEFIK